MCMIFSSAFGAKVFPLLILLMLRIWHSSSSYNFKIVSYDAAWAENRTHHLPPTTTTSGCDTYHTTVAIFYQLNQSATCINLKLVFIIIYLSISNFYSTLSICVIVANNAKLDKDRMKSLLRQRCNTNEMISPYNIFDQFSIDEGCSIEIKRTLQSVDCLKGLSSYLSSWIE